MLGSDNQLNEKVEQRLFLGVETDCSETQVREVCTPRPRRAGQAATVEFELLAFPPHIDVFSKNCVNW